MVDTKQIWNEVDVPENCPVSKRVIFYDDLLAAGLSVDDAVQAVADQLGLPNSDKFRDAILTSYHCDLG